MKIVNFSTCSSSFLRHLGSCTSVVISIPLPALVSFLYFLFVYSFPLASIAKKASEALVSLFLKGYAQRMVEKFQVSQKLKKNRFPSVFASGTWCTLSSGRIIYLV